jgi:GNAT superfamily N-acetyltransferase
MASALDIYFSALVDAVRTAATRTLDGNIVLAPDASRAGGGSATSYPTPAGTIIWCDPAIVGVLSEVIGDAAETAIASDDFVELAIAAGATLLGFGRNRVLEGALRHPRLDALAVGLSVRLLDRESAADVALLADLASAASADDLDEADLDLDNLDPFYVGLLEKDRLAAYACGRPSEINERFDDIGVLVHPSFRRRGLGAHVVGEFIERRGLADPDRLMLYRCTTENAASNAIAESLNFTLAHTIGAVRFP